MEPKEQSLDEFFTEWCDNQYGCKPSDLPELHKLVRIMGDLKDWIMGSELPDLVVLTSFLGYSKFLLGLVPAMESICEKAVKEGRIKKKGFHIDPEGDLCPPSDN